MDRVLSELPSHNLFYLLSERESSAVTAEESSNGLDDEFIVEKDSNNTTSKSAVIGSLVYHFLLSIEIPCKSSKAATAWRKQRDQLLVEYLQLFLAGGSDSKCFLLVSSVSEVNTTLAFLRQVLPSSAEAFTGIGRSPELISKLQSSFESAELAAARILVLSAPIALLGLVHGFLQLKAFSSIIFADARGANQAHPFCQLMNHFYTPVGLKAKILGFATLPDPAKVFNLEDVFSRRDWLRQLRHYNRTFQSAVQVIDAEAKSDLLNEFLDDFGKCVECFEPLSILQTCITDDVDSSFVSEAAVVEDLDAEITSMASVLVIKNQTSLTKLLNFIERAFIAGIEKVVHFHSDSELAGRLSLAAFLKRLRYPEQTDLTLLQKVAHEAESILSSQFHLHDCLKMDAESTEALQQFTPPTKEIPLQTFTFDHESAFRVPSTGALASLESSAGILVRACTLIAEPFRTNPEHREVIKLKHFRAFPVDDQKNEKKLSTSPGFIALLKLPQLMQEAIRAHLLTGEAAFEDQFESWFQGSLQLTRLEAQGITALRAIKLLHASGILNDHLMLSDKYCASNETVSIEESVEDSVEVAVGGDDEDEDELAESKVACFDEIIPDALLKSALEDRLYIYALEYELKADDEADPFTLTPDSRILHYSSSSTPSGLNMFSSRDSCLTWSILLPCKLPDGFLPIEVPLGSHHMLKTKLRLIGELPVSSPQHRKLLHLQPILFNLFNMRPLTAPKIGEEVDEMLPGLKIPENKCPFYLIAPLKNDKMPGISHLLSPTELPQLHQVFESFVQSFHAAPLEGAQVNPAPLNTTCPCWSIDWSLCEDLTSTDANVQEANLSEYLTALSNFPSELSVQLEEGACPLNFKNFALSRLLIHTPHTHTIYRPSRLRPEFTPNSPFTSASLPEARTYAEYAQLRYHLPTPVHPDQPLLQVKRIEHWSDLAVWGSLDAASKHRSRTKKRTPDQLPSLLIPEHANILPLPYAAVRMAMLLPRVSAEVERQLRISQFFASSPLLASLPFKPRHRSAVQAMTASSAALSYSYEQLEVLGDSLLKHLSSLDVLAGFGAHGWGEGKLTALRMEKLSNARLCEAGEAAGVFEYATFTPFLARLWTASPQLSDLLLNDSQLDEMMDCVKVVNVNALDSITPFTSYYRSLNKKRISTLFDKEDRWVALNALQGKHSQRTQALLLSTRTGLLTPDLTGHRTRAEKRGRAAVLYRHGQAVPPKKIADVMEALIGVYYADCGVAGALAFLNAVGVLRGDLVQDALCRDALRSEFLTVNRNNLKEASVIEKWKRRKPTPLNTLLIERIFEMGVVSDNSSSQHTSQTLPNSVQSIDNVTPNLPPPSDFPYSQLEGLLNYSFNDRQLLFQAFTHTSGVDGVVVEGDNEVLEWIGDAALDWAVCRYYWYGLRDHSDDIDDDTNDQDTNDLMNDISDSTNVITPSATANVTPFYKCLVEEFDTSLPEFTRPHPDIGSLPLSPDDLTRARQSITNNDALARITVHFGLHRNLRIDSAHLQREIEKFSREASSEVSESIEGTRN